MTHIRKAIVPVIGLATRFLPANKNMPTAMLPFHGRPLIHHTVEEARAAGIEEFIFITWPGKTPPERHVACNPTLQDKTNVAPLELGPPSDPQLPNARKWPCTFIAQMSPLGLGHAVGLAAELIGDEAFAVLLPNDFIHADIPCLKQMIEAHAQIGGNMVATIEVAPEATQSYVVLDIEHRSGRTVRACGVVASPAPADAPSTQGIVGRYILQPSVMARLQRQSADSRGNIQLTDAIAADLTSTPLNGYHFEGRRFDCESVTGYVALLKTPARTAFRETRELV
jgi:UTP--glucose-1-phosphate uridylyltransferase